MSSKNRNIEKGFGFTAEMNEKIKSNYSLEDEKLIWSWFRDLGLEVASSSGPDAFRNHLCSGEVLCGLANTLQPHSISNIHKTANISMTAFLNIRSQENISFFISWCIKYTVVFEMSDFGSKLVDFWLTFQPFSPVFAPFSQNHPRTV